MLKKKTGQIFCPHTILENTALQYNPICLDCPAPREIVERCACPRTCLHVAQPDTCTEPSICERKTDRISHVTLCSAWRHNALDSVQLRVNVRSRWSRVPMATAWSQKRVRATTCLETCSRSTRSSSMTSRALDGVFPALLSFCDERPHMV